MLTKMAVSQEVEHLLAQIALIKQTTLNEDERIKLLEASKSLMNDIQSPKDIVIDVVHSVSFQTGLENITKG
jgi:hypothetical protein